MNDRKFRNDILEELDKVEFSGAMRRIKWSASFCGKRKDWESFNSEPEFGLTKMYIALWILWFCAWYMIGYKRNPVLSAAMLAMLLYLRGNYQVQTRIFDL